MSEPVFNISSADASATKAEFLLSGQGNRQKKKNKHLLDYTQNFLMAVIPLVGFVLFMLVPMGMSFVMSFFEMKTPIFGEGVFVGMKNFRDLLFGEYASLLYQSFGNTLLYWLNVPLSMLGGLFIAVLLNKNIAAKKFFRTVFFIPYVCSLVSVALIFRMMYETNYGVINTVLSVFGVEKVAWITSPKTFMLSAVLMQSWKNLGFCIILFQAALSNVNQSYVEAAAIDGAGRGRIFFSITLPAISSTTYYLLTICTIGALQSMGEVQILSQNHTYVLDYSYNTVVLFLYDMAFSFPYKYGYGISAATSWILVVFILIVTQISAKLSKRWVHHEF